MNHKCKIEGFLYRLRPVKISDAAYIVKVRLEDSERNRFIHPIQNDIAAQENWIRKYLEEENDYYFVIENRLTSEPEGVIAFYNIENSKAEWGRWVVQKSSFAAIESVLLLYRIAFEQVGLNELYCDTILENKSVVSFHNSIGEKVREIRKADIVLNGIKYDSIIHYADKDYFYSSMREKLERNAQLVLKRSLKKLVGGFEFDHIGIATRSIEKELGLYQMFGYMQDGPIFEDALQGIRGVFLTQKGHPKLELIENLEGSTTISKQLELNQKMYHRAYYVTNIERALEILQKNRAKIISPLKPSIYFKHRICFLMLSNMEMIELLEKVEEKV